MTEGKEKESERVISDQETSCNNGEHDSMVVCVETLTLEEGD